MDWNIVWGFKGEGTYVIFNKATPVCLEVNSHNQILIASYEPFNEAQLWDIRSYGGKDVYTIQNVRHLTFLEVFPGMRGIVGSWSPFALLGGIPIEGADPVESLWIIDSSTCCLQEGKMVLFRTMCPTGYVLELRLCAYGNALEIASEEADERVKDKQRWFLQKVA
ncbi:MAG: hypothetical protein Q9228_002168 [Teloschistes exilis]